MEVMNLEEIWKKLEETKLEVAAPVTPDLKSVKSKHPIEKLKKAYRISASFSIVFLLAFVLLFFSRTEFIVKIGIGLVIATYIFLFVINMKMYTKIKVNFPIDQSLKVFLGNTYSFINENILFQQRVSLLTYPFICAAGMLLGLSIEGEKLSVILEERIVIASLVIVPILLTPLCWLMSRWMFRLSYGRCLDELKRLIDELESEH